MIKMFSRLGLAKKLTLTTVFLIACSQLFITALVYLSVTNFGDSFMEHELEDRTRLVEMSLAEPLWSFDRTQLEKVGNSLLLETDFIHLSALKILTPTNEILFEKGPKLEKINFKSVGEMSFTKTSDIKIYRDNQHIGTVLVAITNKGFVESIRGNLIRILMGSMIALLVVSLVLRFYFHVLLNRPLDKILSQVHKIERDNYEVSTFEDLPLELAAISNGLNHALKLVKKRNDDILCYADDLEHLVRDRTAELEGQIAKNLHSARLVAVGEMAADVAHEINNPLTIIDLHVSKIKKSTLNHDIPISHKDVHSSIEKIQSMVSRMAKIIKGLKSLSRDGNADPMEAFSVSAMIEEVKMLVEMKIKGQAIDFKYVIDDSHLEVVGREVQISQVLVNLINNSIDAIAQLPEKWITLNIETTDEFVRFIVTDSGHGISAELQQKIMRPFFTTKDANKGTGLGLSISKNIIEEHEGRFQYNFASSNTQFIFTLRRQAVLKKSA